MIDILIVLFCGTRIGRVILGLLIVYFFVALMGWAIVPFLAIIIGGLCIHASISGIEYCEKGVKMRKTPLIVGSFFLVFALLFIIGSRYYNEKERLARKTYHYYVSSKTEETIDDDTYVPDSVIITKTEKPKAVRAGHPSRHQVSSYASSSSYVDDEEEYDDDNMRGFDPASEDDMEDNGMSRYLDDDDDEGWD